MNDPCFGWNFGLVLGGLTLFSAAEVGVVGNFSGQCASSTDDKVRVPWILGCFIIYI